MNRLSRQIKKIEIFLCFFIGMLILSCSKEPGDHVTRQSLLPPFKEVELLAVFDVDWMESDTYAIEIHGRKDIVDEITFAVVDDVLTIDNTFGMLWLSPENNKIRLTLSGKGLRRLHAEETCSIQSLHTITSDTFLLTLGGKLNIARLQLDCKLFSYYNTSPVGGEIFLEGSSQYVRIYNGSLMAIDARDLTCDYALVENGSKADVKVYVRTQLNYSIRGAGDIYLYGNPGEIIPGELNSTGRLIPQ